MFKKTTVKEEPVQEEGSKGEVVVQKETALPVAAKPVTDIVIRAQEKFGDMEIMDGGEYAGAGLQNIRKEERRLPILRILDPKSPQCKPVAAGGVPGAKGGSIFNSSTGEVYDGEKGLYCVWVSRELSYIEYIKRDDDGGGGGFIAVHEPDEPFVQQMLAKQGKFKKLQSNGEDGQPHETVQTTSIYGVFSDDLSFMAPFKGVVPFQSMQLKKAGQLIDRCDNFKYIMRRPDGSVGPSTPAMWQHCFHITTRYEERGKQSWFGWVIKLAGKDDKGIELPFRESRIDSRSELFKDAAKYNESIEKGDVAPDFAKDVGDAGDAQERQDDNATGTDSRLPKDNKDIPF